MRWWAAVRAPLIAHLHPRFYLMPDDGLFVGMLTAWVSFVAIVTYLLLGWACAGALVTVMGLVGMGAMMVDSTTHGNPPQRSRVVPGHGGTLQNGWLPFQASDSLRHHRVGVSDLPVDSPERAEDTLGISPEVERRRADREPADARRVTPARQVGRKPAERGSSDRGGRGRQVNLVRGVPALDR